jgi:hypothetical protein
VRRARLLRPLTFQMARRKFCTSIEDNPQGPPKTGANRCLPRPPPRQGWHRPESPSRRAQRWRRAAPVQVVTRKSQRIPRAAVASTFPPPRRHQSTAAATLSLIMDEWRAWLDCRGGVVRVVP